MDTQKLLEKAVAEYPFIKQHNPIVTTGDTGEDYAETWVPGEPGSPHDPRPEHIPMDRVGVVIGPKEFSHHDLAGEVLHADQMSNATREQLMNSLSHKQLATLAQLSGDFGQTLEEGRDTKDAYRNATDSAIRGHILNQWPKEQNDRLKYRPEQLELLNNLKTYMKSEPSEMHSGGIAMPHSYSHGNWKLI
jgi:hypothetical protein